ncbi:MAG TPA: choice-of-anchor D domain-containing protein [Ktedonobacterales bacterium]|nr:choice-of-anchor D domain-containing protein [Ktedonobacterales bacterium]
MALDLSSVPLARRQQVVLAWFNDSGDYLPGANNVYYNLPSSYTIEANPAGASVSPPSAGWVTLVTVTGNSTNQREHAFNLSGYNWVRMSVTVTKGSSGNYAAAFNVDIYDASAGVLDSWLFLGDSITAEGMAHANIAGGPWTGGDYAQLVNTDNPSYYPLQIDGGMGGWTSDTGAQNISALMNNFIGHYVGLAFGTNDANQGVLLSSTQIQHYYANVLTMIDAVQNAGDIAIVPFVPWGCSGRLGQNAQALNNYVSLHLATDRPGAILGPDLWTPFSQNPSWIAPDCIHPTYSAPSGQLSGYEQYQRIWERWAIANIYTPSNAPVVSFSPTSLNLGSVTVGATSAVQTVTLTNSGQAAVSITGISITGANAVDFAQSNDCPTGTSTLAVGASCAIDVTFAPTSGGSRSAAVSVSDNAAGSPQSVALSGTGLGPAVSLNPGSLSFGTVLVGSSSATRSVTLTNTGNTDLHISSVALGGANPGDFGVTTTCPVDGSALAPGANCALSSAFTPSTSGARVATIQVVDDASNSPQSVALSGTGSISSASVGLSSTTLTFSAAFIGSTSKAQTVTLTNTGTIPLAIYGITIGGANPGDFAQTNTCPISPGALAQGASCKISVRFTPSAQGARSANVSITDNATNSPQTVSLSGQGKLRRTH